MRRLTAPRLRVRAATVLVAALALVAPAGSPASAAPGGAGAQSLRDFGACLATAGHADVLLLMDQSGSLAGSDPEDVRVPAAQLLLSRFADTAGRTGGSIDLAVAGFDSAVHPAVDWAPLDAENVTTASRAVEDFADRQDGVDTDYWTALTSARQMLLDHREAGAGRHCQALVLFTDGQFDFSARETAADQEEYGTTKPFPGARDIPLTSEEAVDRVVDIGKRELCRPGGVTDALRTDDILLVALGLDASATGQLSFLQRIAVNQPSSCGAQPAYGYFTAATDVSGLVLSFDAVGDPSNPPLPVGERGVCVVQVCSEQAHTFQLDTSISSIHLVGTSSAAGIDVHIQPPGADPVTLSYAAGPAAGTVRTGSLTIPYRWYADGAFVIDVEAPPGGVNWSGTWQVVFVDTTGQNPDAVSKTQLTIQADLAAALHEPSAVEWRAGEETAPLRFDLIRSNGGIATVGTPAPTLALDVSLRSASGVEVRLAKGLTRQQLLTPGVLAVPADFPAGPAELRTRLSVTTVSGLALQPQIRTEPVTVGAAFGTPSVTTHSVAFGAATVAEPATARLAVAGPGCVWIEEGRPTLDVHPADIGAGDLAISSPTASSAADCLEIGEGETGTLDMTLAPDGSSAGDIGGSFAVHLAPEKLSPEARAERATVVQLPFTAEVQRVANSSVFLLAFALALTVGIGIPVLVLMGGRRLAARLPTAALQSALVDVTVGAGGVRLVGGGPLTAPERWDLVPPPQSGRRRTRLSSIPIRARAGTRLSDAGFAEVEDERRVGVSGAPGGRSPRSLSARLPLALQGSWTLLVDRPHAESDDTDVPAQLLVVSDSAATQQQREDLFIRARDEVPAAAQALREAARNRRSKDRGPSAGPPSAPVPAAADPFGGGPFGSGIPSPRTSAMPVDPFAPAATGPSTPSAAPVPRTAAPGAFAASTTADPFNR